MKKIFNFIKKHKIFTIITIVIFVIAVVWPISKKAIAKPEQRYETVKAQKENLSDSVFASGAIQAEEQIELRFQTPGLLSWVGVKEGDEIKRWQAIASLDKRELEKNLLKTLRDYNKERWDFDETTQTTYRDQIVTDTLRRILEKNQFDLDKAVADVEIKNLAIELATLYSPIDGIVIQIDNPIAGVNVTPINATFTIANPTKMKFVANVDEVDIGKIEIGQKIILTLDAYPDQEIKGEIGKVAFASVTTRGGGTAFPIEIYLPENQNLQFKVGMNGDLEITISKIENVLTIPNEAINKKEGKKFVSIIKGRKIEEIEIETGFTSETKAQVVKGLNENETIIIREKTK